MSQTEVAHAVFHKHQTTGACAGECMCNCMHQMERTVKYDLSDLLRWLQFITWY